MPFVAGKAANPTGIQRSKPFNDALRRALAQGDPERLRLLAETLLDKAADGDMAAIKEVADRLDGKPAQMLMGDAQNPFTLVARWKK